MKRLITFPLALPFFILLLLLPLILLAAVAILGLSAEDIAGQVLGLSPLKAVLLYLAILVGGLINLPVYDYKSPGGTQPPMVPYLGARYKMPQWLGHRTVVSVNVGGCIIPVALALYYALRLPLAPTLLTTTIVTLGVFYVARPVRSVGVMVPALVPPLLAVGASLVALYIAGSGYEDLARIAFVAGAIGTLVGADILHMGDIRRAGAESVSIGGAGTFDGIVLTGVLGAVLAAIIASL